MRRISWLLIIVAVIALPVLASAQPAATPAEESSPVVVELFTSQGCSTCPPADHLLSEMGSPGSQVIPLAFHVDYWNQQGWNDPFSSSKWSARQAKYDQAIGLSEVATPQFIFNGHTQVTGSLRTDVIKTLEAAAAVKPAGSVNLTAHEEGTGRKRKVIVKVDARLNREPAHSLDLWVAVTQSGLTTDVKAGENKSATLHDDFVVRHFEKVFSLRGKEGTTKSGDVKIDIDPDWNASNVTVVAFLQDAANLTIEGAAAQSTQAAAGAAGQPAAQGNGHGGAQH